MKKVLFALMSLAFINVHADEDESEHQKHKHKHCVDESHFEKWVKDRTEKLDIKGRVKVTTSGPVQYLLRGKGPVVLALHGGFGGWDQGELIAEHIRDEGFALLTVSRPGYLGTSLPWLPPLTEFTPAQQADVIVSLLDALEIEKVGVIGFSAGGPVAYALAQNYPDRVAALVLESIGANPSEDVLFYLVLGSALSVPVVPDYISYLVYLSTRFDFYSTAKEITALDTNLTGDELKERFCAITKHHDQFEFLRKMIFATTPISPRLPGILNDFLGVDYWTTSFDPTGFTTPTVIVQAINDSNGYYPTAQSVSSQLPTSQLIPVEDSGHFIWLGPKSREWQKQVHHFLKEHKESMTNMDWDIKQLHDRSN